MQHAGTLSRMLEVARHWMGVRGYEDQEVGIYVAAIPELLDHGQDVGLLPVFLQLHVVQRKLDKKKVQINLMMDTGNRHCGGRRGTPLGPPLPTRTN